MVTDESGSTLQSSLAKDLEGGIHFGIGGFNLVSALHVSPGLVCYSMVGHYNPIISRAFDSLMLLTLQLSHFLESKIRDIYEQ